jgi:hypothetical protein
MFVSRHIDLMLLSATLVILIAFGYRTWGKNPKMPWYFCLVGGLFGYVTSLVFWWFFGMLVWLPYQTRQRFGIDLDAEGWGLGEIFVPLVVGVLFLLSTLASVLALRQPMRYRKIAVVGSNMVPALLLILPVIGSSSLSYLGFVMLMLLTGLCWGLLLYGIAIRRTKFIFTQS